MNFHYHRWNTQLVIIFNRCPLYDFIEKITHLVLLKGDEIHVSLTERNLCHILDFPVVFQIRGDDICIDKKATYSMAKCIQFHN